MGRVRWNKRTPADGETELGVSTVGSSDTIPLVRTRWSTFTVSDWVSDRGLKVNHRQSTSD